MSDESKMNDETGSGKARQSGAESAESHVGAVPDNGRDAAGMPDRYAMAMAVLFACIILSASIYFSISSLSATLAGISIASQSQNLAAAVQPQTAAALAPGPAQARAPNPAPAAPSAAGCGVPSAPGAPSAPSAAGCGVPAGSPGSPAGAVANLDVSNRPVRGSPDAKVTIVEFSDFECPFCQRAEPTVRQVMNDYSGKVRLVYMQFPLSFHPNAQKAAEANECAGDQGKFWEYHDRLFDTAQLDTASLKAHAASLGMDTARFNQCLDSGANAAKVAAMQGMGSQNGVSGTPTFFINGTPLVGAQPYANFKAAIDRQLAGSGG